MLQNHYKSHASATCCAEQQEGRPQNVSLTQASLAWVCMPPKLRRVCTYSIHVRASRPAIIVGHMLPYNVRELLSQLGTVAMQHMSPGQTSLLSVFSQRQELPDTQCLVLPLLCTLLWQDLTRPVVRLSSPKLSSCKPRGAWCIHTWHGQVVADPAKAVLHVQTPLCSLQTMTRAAQAARRYLRQGEGGHGGRQDVKPLRQTNKQM